MLFAYTDETRIRSFEGETPSIVWKKLGILTKYDGETLFGIKHPNTQSLFQLMNHKKSFVCTPNEWSDENILERVFDEQIKSRKIPMQMLDWKTLFREWYNQKSNIVQFPKILGKIYPLIILYQRRNYLSGGPCFEQARQMLEIGRAGSSSGDTIVIGNEQ